jgi:hypothetical protein
MSQGLRVLVLGGEAAEVMTFLQKRGLDEDEACAAMGLAISCPIAERGELESFIKAMRASYRKVRQLAAEKRATQ